MSERWRGTAMLAPRERQRGSAAARPGTRSIAPADEGDTVEAPVLQNGIASGWLTKRTEALAGAPDVPDPLAIRIGEEIAARRQKLGMSQQELARAIGCDRSAVSRWEMGLRLPSLLHLIAAGRVLGCGARALLPE